MNTIQTVKLAKFNIGDVVKHQHQGYRAVVIDVDPQFQASGRYNPLANQHAFTTKNPWYRLLVDNSNQQTYVEEPLLIKDSDDHQEISNPQVGQYLVHHNGRYLRGCGNH
jgi:heat shock protein HspQ